MAQDPGGDKVVAFPIHQGRHRSTPDGSGPDDPGPGLEARVAKLEAHIEHIQGDINDIKSDVREIKRDARADFRVLFGAIIFVALGLAGLMAKGFHWIGG
jgi:hypothetical protein